MSNTKRKLKFSLPFEWIPSVLAQGGLRVLFFFLSSILQGPIFDSNITVLYLIQELLKTKFESLNVML